MSEIEIGEYVRTADGKIDKIIEIANNYVLLKSKMIISEYGESRAFIKTTDIVKHSKNIIDLIEEGDIVCIKDIMYDGEYKSEVFENFDNILCINNSEGDEIIELNENIENKQIELLSILTHEIYEREAYKIE